MSENNFATDLLKLLDAISSVQAQGGSIQEKKYGLIGKNVSHSLSKQLHGLIGGYNYNLIELRDEKRLAEVIKMQGYYGFNVTNPYKESVMPLLDELSDAAREIGAVNTIKKMPDGRIKGFNTDYLGFKKMFAPGFVKGKRVAVLGTGGAALAVKYALKELDAQKIYMVSRHPKTVEQCSYTYNGWKDAQIIVNTTPVGMYPLNNKSPLDDALIGFDDFYNLEAAVDIIYNPRRTKFLQDAEKTGLKTIGGLGMLIWQGIFARDIWGDKEFADEYALVEAVMEKILRKQVNLITVGMPGSGKSSVSRQIGKALRCDFFDLDRQIAYKEGRKPHKIIECEGVEAFRKIETRILREACEGHFQVIATGGGTIVKEENCRLMRENGIVLYIKRPLNLLTTKNRPISQKYGVHRLYEERASIYEGLADFIVDNKLPFGAPKLNKNKMKGLTKRQIVDAEQDLYLKDIRRFARYVVKKYKMEIKRIVENDSKGLADK